MIFKILLNKMLSNWQILLNKMLSNWLIEKNIQFLMFQNGCKYILAFSFSWDRTQRFSSRVFNDFFLQDKAVWQHREKRTQKEHWVGFIEVIFFFKKAYFWLRQPIFLFPWFLESKSTNKTFKKNCRLDLISFAKV